MKQGGQVLTVSFLYYRKFFKPCIVKKMRQLRPVPTVSNSNNKQTQENVSIAESLFSK